MDEQALRQAFREHKDSVYAFAFRMTNSAAAADDITQDCFLELIQRSIQQSLRFDPSRGSLRNYLFGIARHLALRRWRRDERFVAMDDEETLPLPESLSLDAAIAVAEAIQSLPPRQREVVVLIEYEGLTLEEAAAVTQIDIGAVKSRLHRAREKLRQRLAPLLPMNRES